LEWKEKNGLSSHDYSGGKMKTICALSCVAFGLFLGAPQSKADSLCNSIATNLVANCGFETGDFTSWTLAGNDVPGELGNLYGVEGTDPYPLPDGTAPNSGNFQAFFSDLAANPTTLSQSIATVAGQQYTISFYMAQELVGPGTVNNDLLAKFGSVTLDNLSDVGVQGYTEYSFNTVATSSSSLLSLSFGNDIGEFLVDDISVVASPEPSAWALMLVVAMGSILVWKRQARGAAGLR
jgi:hypothetical protein